MHIIHTVGQESITIIIYYSNTSNAYSLLATDVSDVFLTDNGTLDWLE